MDADAGTKRNPGLADDRRPAPGEHVEHLVGGLVDPGARGPYTEAQHALRKLLAAASVIEEWKKFDRVARRLDGDGTPPGQPITHLNESTEQAAPERRCKTAANGVVFAPARA